MKFPGQESYETARADGWNAPNSVAWSALETLTPAGWLGAWGFTRESMTRTEAILDSVANGELSPFDELAQAAERAQSAIRWIAVAVIAVVIAIVAGLLVATLFFVRRWFGDTKAIADSVVQAAT